MLRDYVNRYIEDFTKRGNAQGSINTYRSNLNKFIRFIDQNSLDFRILTTKQVKILRNMMVEQGLKPRTINSLLSSLKGLYDYLIEEEVINRNPILSGRLRVKQGKSLPGFMTDKELEILNNWLDSVPHEVSLGFRTMLATGLRVSELYALTPRDIILLESGGYLLRVRHGKGNRERYVPVMDGDVAWDLACLKERRAGGPLFFIISPATFQRWARKCRAETGVKFHSHRCRHTVATQMLKKGIPLDHVQEVLGHINITTTRVYAQTALESILELAAKIDDDEIKESRAVYRYLLSGD
jgi:site-specific recombinase XerD